MQISMVHRKFSKALAQFHRVDSIALRIDLTEFREHSLEHHVFVVRLPRLSGRVLTMYPIKGERRCDFVSLEVA